MCAENTTTNMDIKERLWIVLEGLVQKGENKVVVDVIRDARDRIIELESVSDAFFMDGLGVAYKTSQVPEGAIHAL